MYNLSSNNWQLNSLQFNCIIAAISSFLLFSGWWILVDPHVHNALEEHSTYYLPGITATFAFFFINIIPAHFFYDSLTYQHGCFTPGVARTYLFLWLMISFGSLISAFYILVNDFILHPQIPQWPGYGIWLHNVFIFFSNMLLRFGKKYSQFY